jgi:RNA-directed DNA polymerase
MELDELLRSINQVLRGWANFFRHAVSKAVFNAVDSHTWLRLMQWIRAKYTGKHPLGMNELRRRFCDRGWRFAHNGVVFTGAASVTVERYRYRGNDIPTPWTRNRQPAQTADQRERHVERPVHREVHAGCGRGPAGDDRWRHRHRARGPTSPTI